MATISFERFIERHYKGMNFISIPSGVHVPGVILNNNDRVETALARLFPTENPAKWATIIVPANIPNETVKGNRGLSLDFALLGMLGIKGSVTANYEIEFRFEEVSSLVFDTGYGAVFENDVRSMIMELKNRDHDAWKQILHEFVAMEAVIVKRAVLSIKRNGQAIGEANFPTHAGEVTINAKFEWKADGTMVIENVNNIPFGLLGFQVKRNM